MLVASSRGAPGGPSAPGFCTLGDPSDAPEPFGESNPTPGTWGRTLEPLRVVSVTKFQLRLFTPLVPPSEQRADGLGGHLHLKRGGLSRTLAVAPPVGSSPRIRSSVDPRSPDLRPGSFREREEDWSPLVAPRSILSKRVRKRLNVIYLFHRLLH